MLRRRLMIVASAVLFMTIGRLWRWWQGEQIFGAIIVGFHTAKNVRKSSNVLWLLVRC